MVTKNAIDQLPSLPQVLVQILDAIHSDNADYAPAFVGTFDPILANVLAQDGSNMVSMQNGVKSDSFKGMKLCDQELRLRHFHQTIDRFIAGEVSTRNLPASDAYLEK